MRQRTFGAGAGRYWDWRMNEDEPWKSGKAPGCGEGEEIMGAQQEVIAGEGLTEDQRALLRAISENSDLLTLAHLAVEDELADLRDRHMWVGIHGNGLVIKERDGNESSIIRLGTREGIRMALAALAGASPERVREMKSRVSDETGRTRTLT
jgi:hypothetical protein